MCTNGGQNAIYCRSTYGPCFGDKELFIESESNKIQNSESALLTYRHPEYESGSDEANSILAGSFKFQTEQIEVFVKESSFSAIPNTILLNKLNQLCEIDFQKWKLIYRALTDEFGIETFHEKCEKV